MLKKKCQLASDFNSDRYDRSQTTDLNNSTTRYHPATALTAFVNYNSACRPLLSQSGLRGPGVRAVGVATLNANSVKKQSINAKSEPSKCSGLAISRRRQNYAKIGVGFRPQG